MHVPKDTTTEQFEREFSAVIEFHRQVTHQLRSKIYNFPFTEFP